MVEQSKTENGQNGAVTQEEKKHDVQYADSETAGLVSDYPTHSIPSSYLQNALFSMSLFSTILR